MEERIEEAHDTFYAFRCNDDPPSNEPAAAQRCRAFLGERYGDSLALPLRSDIPALVMVGEFDPRTLPSSGHRMIEGLEHGHLVILLPWYGHMGLPDCQFHMADEFLRAPERAPDTSCLDSIAAVQFATSIVPSRWVDGAMADVASHPLRVAVPAGALLLLLVPLVGVPARAPRATSRTHALGLLERPGRPGAATHAVGCRHALTISRGCAGPGRGRARHRLLVAD